MRTVKERLAVTKLLQMVLQMVRDKRYKKRDERTNHDRERCVKISRGGGNTEA